MARGEHGTRKLKPAGGEPQLISARQADVDHFDSAAQHAIDERTHHQRSAESHVATDNQSASATVEVEYINRSGPDGVRPRRVPLRVWAFGDAANVVCFEDPPLDH